MQIRFVRLHSRNPLVGAALLVVALALVLAMVVLGLALLAGLAVVGAVALLARRLLGARRPTVPPPASLDPSLEVFAQTEVRSRGQLPPDAR